MVKSALKILHFLTTHFILMIFVIGCNESFKLKKSDLPSVVTDMPPVLYQFSCTSLFLNEGEQLNCLALGFDPEGQVSYRLSSSNTCTDAVIDPNSGIISMNAIAPFVPGCSLIVEAWDGAQASVPISLNLSVTNMPLTLHLSDVTLTEDTVLVKNDLAVEASEGDYGTYSIEDSGTTVPKCSSIGVVSVDAVSGAVSFTAPNFYGSCNITVQYENGNGEIISDEFNLTYTPVNDAPVISGSCAGDGVQDIAYSCSSLSAIDPEGDSFIWSLDTSNTCSFLSLDASGNLTGTPNDDQVGNCILAVKIDDGSDTSVYSRSISITNVQPSLIVTNKATNDPIGPVIIATDAQVQASEEGYGFYSIDSTNTTGIKCSDNGTISIDPVNGQITFDGTDGYVGICYVRVVFNDQNTLLSTASSQFSLTVTDGTPPIVQQVSSLNTDGTYYLNDIISIKVSFNENVIVDTTNGIPRLLVDTGYLDRYASYVSGSGSRDLVFNYTVQVDDVSSDLDIETSPGSIELNNGLITDTFGNSQIYMLPVGTDANSLKSLKSIVVTGAYPFAILGNIPTLVSRTSKTAIEVSGTDVISYKYKWGLKTTIDCSDPVGYSVEKSINIKIEENLTSIVIGNDVRFCVVGKNTAGIFQPFNLATIAEWRKGEYSIEPISLSGLSNLPNWKDVTIDSKGRIIARNARGEIFRSLDNGVSWQLQCKITNDNNSHFKVDPSPNGNTYVVAAGALYKIDNINGIPCVKKSLPTHAFSYSYFSSPIAIDSDGSLFLFVGNGTIQRDDIFKSTDFGESWSLHSSLIDQGWLTSVGINPADKSKWIRTAATGNTSSSNGVYASSDGGLTFTKVGTNGWNLINLQYKLTTPGTIYGTFGNYFSSDGQVEIGMPPNSGVIDSRRFHIDTNGTGYYLQEFGTDTQLRKSSNYGVTSYTVPFTFNNVSSNTLNQAVSARGNLVTTVLGGRMFISTDYGNNFNEVPWQGTKLALFTGISTKDGNTVYGVTSDWNIVKSTDLGDSWSLVYTYGNGCPGKEPRIDTHELEPGKFSIWSALSNCKEYVASKDGGTTIDSGRFSTTSPQVHVTDPRDPNFEAFWGGNSYLNTFNSGFEWQSSVKPSISSSIKPDGYFDSKLGFIWVLDNTSLKKYSTFDDLITTINTGVTAAGFEAFVNDSGVFELRVKAQSGKVRRSLDNGISFSDLGSNPDLPPCATRYFQSLPQNRNVMASICQSGDDLTFTTDGGANWRTIDLDGIYNINCDAAGIAIHTNKIFVACKSYDVIYVKYNALELTNEVSDSILSLSDKLQSNPLVRNTIADEFTSNEYALIPAGATCDASLTFSNTIPRTDDASISSSGFYQICARLTDSLFNVSFEKSPLFRFDGTVPDITGISLVGALSDFELKRHEFLDLETPVVGNISGSGFDTSSYAVIPEGDVCDGTRIFSFSEPTANFNNQFVYLTPGSWKICARVSDKAGNGYSYLSSATFTFSDVAVYSSLSNLPALVDNELDLNISVGGNGVVAYKYKIGLRQSTDCYSSVGYGAEALATTPITDNLNSYRSSLAVFLKICVVARDTLGNWQPFKEATTYDWNLWRYKGENIALDNPQEVNNWKSAHIDIHNSSDFYALDFSSTIYKSSNAGATWTSMCRLPFHLGSETVSFHQSRYADQNIYLFANGNVFAVKELSQTSDCPNLTSMLPYASSNYGINHLEIGPGGVLYFLIFDSRESRESIFKSTNFGLSWIRTGNGVDSSYTTSVQIQLKADPTVPMRLWASYLSTARPDLYGVYRSNDDGKTWTRIRTFSGPSYIEPSYTTPEKWNIVGPTRQCTSDNFSTVSSCTRNFSYMIGSNINGTHQSSFGEYFYTVSSNNNSTLYDSYSVWKFGASESSAGSKLTDLPLLTSQPLLIFEGNSALVLGGGKLLISTDAGLNFNRINPLNPHLLPLSIFRTSIHGEKLAAKSGETFMDRSSQLKFSKDYGKTWSSFFNPNEKCGSFYSLGLDFLDFRYAHSANACSPFSIKSYTGQRTLTYPFNAGSGLAENPDFPENQYKFSPSFISRTNDHWQTFSYKPMPLIANAPTLLYNFHSIGVVHSTDPSILFLLTKQSTDPAYSHLFVKYNFEDGTYTDILTNSNFPTIAAIASAKNGLGGQFLFSISPEGKVERSSDNGSTFSVINSVGLGGSASCSTTRFYYVNPDDHRIQATACNSEIYISIDGGVNFSLVPQSFFISSSASSCSIMVASFDGNNLYYKCTNQTIKVPLSDVKLSSDVADNLLDSSEQGLAQPLVEASGTDYQSEMEFAVVSSNVVCNGTLTYSPVIPTTLNSAFSAPGNYKVCIKYTEGTTRYKETEVITFTSGLPVFNSISLINQLSDNILSESEFLGSFDYITSIPSASNFSSISYAVVGSADTCSLASSYSSHRIRANFEGHSPNFQNLSTYKICVKVQNLSGSVFGETASFSFEKDYPTAKLVTLPQFIELNDSFDSLVTGIGVTDYRYKIGWHDATNCASNFSYSAIAPVSTPIAQDLSNLQTDRVYKICLIGRNGLGQWQPITNATEYYFGVSTIKANYLTVQSPGLSNFVKVKVSPYNSNDMAVLNLSGEVFRSRDAGVSWEFICRLNKPVDYTNGNQRDLVFANDDKNSLYHGGTFWGDGTYLIAPSSTEFCKRIGMGLGVDSVGNIYVTHNKYFSSPFGVLKSSDQGATWTTLYTYSNFSGGNDDLVHVSRADDDVIFLLSNSAGSQFLVSTDAGVTWSNKNTSHSFTINNPLTSSPLLPNAIFQSSSGRSSIDLGVTFGNLGARVDFNNDGVAYRLRYVNLNSTILESNTDILNSTTWSPIFNFTSGSLTSSSPSYESLSVSGTRIAVIIGRKLFISSDSGSTFNEVNIPGSNLGVVGFEATQSGNYYAFTRENALLESIDTGDTWALKNFLGVTEGTFAKSFSLPFESSGQIISLISTGGLRYSGDYFTSSSSSGTPSTQLCFYDNLIDPNNLVLSSSNTFYFTTNGFSTLSTQFKSASPNCASDPKNYINPLNSDQIFSVNTSSPNLSVFSLSSDTGTSLLTGSTTNLRDYDLVDYSGTYVLRVVSDRGVIRESTNLEAFVTFGTSSVPITSNFPSLMQLESDRLDRDTVMIIDKTNNTLYFTKDGSSSWLKLDLRNFASLHSCYPNDGVVFSKGTGKRALISCDGYRAIILDF